MERHPLSNKQSPDLINNNHLNSLQGNDVNSGEESSSDECMNGTIGKEEFRAGGDSYGTCDDQGLE